MSNILVTGGAGYIGSHTCKLLATHGHTPVTIDNLSTGHKSFVKWGPLVNCDLQNTKEVIKAISNYKPLAIIHFAASAYIGESVLNPLKYYSNNVTSTISLLKAMEQTGIKNLVFSSTCSTYGLPTTSIISESHPQTPINPYGHSKLICENIISALVQISLINCINLRYFNAAGADPEAEIGELHNPETHIIPLAIHSALHGSTLKINGSDFPTPDGTAIRDYIHVYDLADAHIKAINLLLHSGRSCSINLGTGKGTSILEIIDNLKILGFKPKTLLQDRREGDPPYLVANASKALTELGWSPKLSSIPNILETAINWHAMNPVKTNSSL